MQETRRYLLSRDDFRERVFARDKHTCVVCGNPATEAHHIVERRLWEDHGYYLDNGASVCNPCHWKCESTEISAALLRERCGIKIAHLPPHLAEGEYDKWGNPILPNGQRLIGELFYDDSVQRIMAPVLHLFTSRVKYPRTFHAPWSPGVGADDKVIDSLSAFADSDVVVTVKVDGENTTMYRDYIHARSLDSDSHPSRSLTKQLWATIRQDIPENWRVCGENAYARHSIHYRNLDHHFLVFSIWDRNVCLSWDDTVAYAKLLGLHCVPVLYRGPWNESLIRTLHRDTYDGDPCEGYVCRVSDSFTYSDFRRKVFKYVRRNHVTTDDHWKEQIVVPNKWKGEDAY